MNIRLEESVVEPWTNRCTGSVQSSAVVGPPAEWPRSLANVPHQEMAETSPESARICTRLRRYGQRIPSKEAAASIPFQSGLPSVWASSRKRGLPRPARPGWRCAEGGNTRHRRLHPCTPDGAGSGCLRPLHSRSRTPLTPTWSQNQKKNYLLLKRGLIDGRAIVSTRPPSWSQGMRTRATGSLFFLPDDRRVRARAEVKAGAGGGGRKIWTGFWNRSTAVDWISVSVGCKTRTGVLIPLFSPWF